MKIQAAMVRDKGGKFEIETMELEEPRDDEVLVRVAGCGVCHTDLAIRDQYYPTPLPCVLGHEGSGVVEKVGSKVANVKPGDHVVMSYLSCGRCDTCKTGNMGYCPDMYTCNFSGGRMDGSSPLTMDGDRVNGCFFSQSSFATHCLANEHNVVKVSDDIPLEMLGPLGCGVQTGAGAVINALKPEAGSSIAIFGVGTVGISAIMAALVCGCTKIIAVDINNERLELAKSFGATHGINGKETDPVAAIQELTGGAGVQYSLEAIGNPMVTRQAVDCLRTTGLCGLIGAAPMGSEVKIDMNMILFGRTLRGIIEGDAIPQKFIPEMIELYRQGRFPIDKMMTYYDFKDINKAVEDLEKGKIIKGIVTM
jgi:aryl-alcohol dehydrogenase